MKCPIFQNMTSARVGIIVLALIGVIGLLKESFKTVLILTREQAKFIKVPETKPVDDKFSVCNSSLKSKDPHWFTSDDFLAIRSGDAALSFDHPKVIEYARRQLLGPSPLSVSPLSRQNDYSQVGQSAFIDNLLNKKTNGFYVECGAATGEVFSNSLFFDIQRNWQGLLVEPNPIFFEKILSKNRHAYTINACLSPDNQTKALKFTSAGLIGGLSKNMDDSHKQLLKREEKQEETLIICFPIHSLLLALGRTHVDYFSLDVEGAEIEILKTIPWGVVTINTFTIEYRIMNGNNGIDTRASQEKLEKIREIFHNTGLLPPVLANMSDVGKYVALDVVFKRKEIIH